MKEMLSALQRSRTLPSRTGRTIRARQGNEKVFRFVLKEGIRRSRL